MGFATNDQRLNPNINVHWIGWHSTLYNLQQNGWVVSVEQNHAYMESTFRFRHETLELVAQSRAYEMREFERSEPIHIQWLASIKHLSIQVMTQPNLRFEDLDVAPTAEPITSFSGDVASMFKMRKIERVFIEQADLTVIEHLQAIKDKQHNKQSEIRDRMLNQISKSDKALCTTELINVA